MPKTTNPRKTELHLYRLEPAPQMRDRDEWAASTVKETCFVWATSAQEARTMVEIETRTRQSQSQTKLPFFSPWSSSSFTTCEEVAPGSDASLSGGHGFHRSRPDHGSVGLGAPAGAVRPSCPS